MYNLHIICALYLAGSNGWGWSFNNELLLCKAFKRFSLQSTLKQASIFLQSLKIASPSDSWYGRFQDSLSAWYSALLTFPAAVIPMQEHTPVTCRSCFQSSLATLWRIWMLWHFEEGECCTICKVPLSNVFHSLNDAEYSIYSGSSSTHLQQHALIPAS